MKSKAILLLGCLTLGLFLLLFADRSGGVSETENRTLQPFPELRADAVASGRYMEEFENYLSDAFPARLCHRPIRDKPQAVV